MSDIAIEVISGGGGENGSTVSTGDVVEISVTGDATPGINVTTPSGDRGPKGDTGAVATTIEAYATTGAPGSNVAVTQTVTEGGARLRLDFSIPRGDVGATGPAGPAGPAGQSGSPGAAGQQGPAGSQGPAGQTGAAGQQGPAGPQGPAGTGGLSWVSVPASPTAAGTVGQAAQDENYLYLVHGTNAWLRVDRDAWILPPSAPLSFTAVGSVGDLSGIDLFAAPGPWGTGQTTGIVSLAWSAPASNGGGAITGYAVRLEWDGPGSPLTATVATGPDAHVFESVPWQASLCRSLTATVRAINSAGQGAAATTTAFLPSISAPTLGVSAASAAGGETAFSLRWVPVCRGNGGLTANGSPVSDDFTHYEVQNLDVGGSVAGADGSGSYYGWRGVVGTVTPSRPTNPDNGVPLAGWPASVNAVTLTSNAGYFTPFNTALRFRVRTVRIVSGAVVAAGTWSNVVEASWA